MGQLAAWVRGLFSDLAVASVEGQVDLESDLGSDRWGMMDPLVRLVVDEVTSPRTWAHSVVQDS